MRNYEYTLSELLLKNKRKKEILFAASIFGLKISPRLRNEEIACQLSELILNNPVNLLEHLPEYEVVRLQKMIHSPGSQIELSPYAVAESYIATMGLTDVYTFEGAEYEFIYSDLAQSVGTVIDQYVADRPRRKERIHLEQLIMGLINLYGIIPLSSIYPILYYMDSSLTEEKLMETIRHSYQLSNTMEDDTEDATMSSPFVESVACLLDDITARMPMMPATFTEEELLLAGSREYPLYRNKETKKIMKYFKKAGFTEEEAEERLGYFWTSINNGDKMDVFFDFFYDKDVFKSLADSDAALEVLIPYINQLPRWDLLGNTPDWDGNFREMLNATFGESPLPDEFLTEDIATREMAEDPEVKERIMNNLFMENTGTPFKKVGRNDPCPCGSGKKYKQCCGNN